MNTRRVSLLLVFLLLPGQAWAHLHKKEASFGPSFVEGSTLFGVDLSGVVLLPRMKKENGVEKKGTGPWALFADFGANRGQHEGAHRTRIAGMAGLRRVWVLGESKRVQPFAHLMVGVVGTTDSGPSAHDTAWGPGGGAGVDFCLGKHADTAWWARVQGDYVRLMWSEGFARSYSRVSTSLVFRFGEY